MARTHNRHLSVGAAAIGAVAALALALGGCGSGESDGTAAASAQPDQVVSDYWDALSSGDGSAACSLSAPAQQDKWQEYSAISSSSPSCENGVEDFSEHFDLDPDLKVGEPKIDGDRATVTVAINGKSGPAVLEQADGSWRVVKLPGD